MQEENLDRSWGRLWANKPMHSHRQNQFSTQSPSQSKNGKSDQRESKPTRNRFILTIMAELSNENTLTTSPIARDTSNLLPNVVVEKLSHVQKHPRNRTSNFRRWSWWWCGVTAINVVNLNVLEAHFCATDCSIHAWYGFTEHPFTSIIDFKSKTHTP